MSFPAWLDPLDRAIESLVPDFVRLRVRVVDQAGAPAIFDCEVSLELITGAAIDAERLILCIAGQRLERDPSTLRIERAIASVSP